MNIHHLPPLCQVARFSLLLRDTNRPGYISLSRFIKNTKKWDYHLTLELGPEFWPHNYKKGSLSLMCINQDKQYNMHYENAKLLKFQQKKVLLEFKDSFIEKKSIEK